MKIILALLTFLFLFSCSESEKKEVEDVPPISENRTMSRSEIKRHIEAQLKIPATEKYSIKFYEENLNDDDTLDLVIAVNMLDRAKEDALASNNVGKRVEMGYMGNFNHFFYYDGASGLITSPISVPSSPLAPLSISFDYITSETHKDIQIDFRIGDSKFRSFYTIVSRAPFQVCQSEIFLDYNTTARSAFSILLENNPQSFAKNIVVYSGEIENIELENRDDIYTADPKITSTGKLVRRWYYSPKHLKYYLKKDEI